MVQDSPRSKFTHPQVTAKGETRATVGYTGTATLWFNTGTLCNIECAHCYIESSPTNDRYVYLRVPDMGPYLDELDAAGEQGIEIGFTGGEPFMAPEILDMIELALERGHSVLVLTNAMQPMMRPRIRAGLKDLHATYGDRLTLRVSLDHHSAEHHDAERGPGAFERALLGLEWLASIGMHTAIAGRTIWGESDSESRAGYSALCDAHGLSVAVHDPTELVLFPEMEAQADPPEITTSCWAILNKHPDSLMCASQRMVVRRKGADSATVLACTLIPYDTRFELGRTLEESRQPVPLNHPFCASFCVLGGGSCSA